MPQGLAEGDELGARGDEFRGLVRALELGHQRHQHQLGPPAHQLEIGGKVLFYPDAALRTAGADVSVAAPWQSYVVQDREVISGQNPFSDQALLKLLLPALDEKKSVSAA